MRVLLLDGDMPTADSATLPHALSTRRIVVESVTNVKDGLALAGTKRFAAILIERRERPAELIKRLRADSGTPIVVLREVKDSDEAIACFENGADDVLVEPLDVDELVARLRSLSRRCHPGDRLALTVDDLTLTPKDATVRRDGRLIDLTDREFEVLEYMMLHRDRVLAYNELADQVSKVERDPYANEIDSTIANLRAKLHTPGKKQLIHVIAGRGYMLSDMPPLTVGRGDGA